MKNFLTILVFSLLLLACNRKDNSSIQRLCFVDYDSLLHSLDTLRLETASFGQDSIEVRDTSVHSGEGSVLHFDSKGRLGLYAFMYDWPRTTFMIRFDSTGLRQRLQPEEVVQWRYNLKKDSLNLTVLLCSIDRNYGNLKLYAGEYCDSTIRLFESSFSKIICFQSTLPIDKKLDNIKVYLKGETMEKCNEQRFFFTDSALIDLK